MWSRILVLEKFSLDCLISENENSRFSKITGREFLDVLESRFEFSRDSRREFFLVKTQLLSQKFAKVDVFLKKERMTHDLFNLSVVYVLN